jgi:3-hydroxyisobutyrate dehydrogenase
VTQRLTPLQVAGARIAASVEEVFTRTRTVTLMLLNEAVTDKILQRGSKRLCD